jgi:hypothetical protein
MPIVHFRAGRRSREGNNVLGEDIPATGHRRRRCADVLPEGSHAVALLAAARTGPIADACVPTGFHTTASDAYLRARPSLVGQVLNEIDAAGIVHSESGALLHDDLST